MQQVLYRSRPCIRVCASSAFLSTPIHLNCRSTTFLPSRSVSLISRRPRPSTPARRHFQMVGAGAPATVAGGISLARDSRGGVLLSERTNSIAVERSTSPLSEVQADLLVICLRGAENSESKESEESTPYELPPVIAKFDTSGALKDAIDDADFRGARGKSTEVVRVAGAPARRVIVYGLGAAEGIENAVRGAAEFAVGKAKDIKGDVRLAVYVDGEMTSAMVTCAAEGAAIGAYTDNRYREKKDNGKKPPEKLLLGGEEILGISEAEFSSAVKRGLVFAAGILTTKEVVAAPANCLTPKALAEAARTVAEEAGLEVKVLGREECEKLGMGCYLGVSQGSSTEPQFIHMTYIPQGGSPAKKVALVGKAVTFDSGGYNLKAGPGSMIELMKWDMGGSGAVLGAARVIGELKPSNVEVHFIMPACENMVSDHAIHPGDILKASNGKTVEVMNTDAEGRLCLADALVYAENLGDLDYVVDIATLTGAIIVSLGHDVAGFWSASDDLADDLLAAGKKSGEKLWRMPLVDEYAEQLKSKISDLKNIGAGRAGSSIIAALFLKEFVKTKNWSHIDIAGTAWADKKGGATGFGVKTLTHWVEGISAQASK